MVDMQTKALGEGILKRDIQMITIAKEGIQKRRHILRRKKKTYIVVGFSGTP
jgi:hypothetical protein